MCVCVRVCACVCVCAYAFVCVCVRVFDIGMQGPCSTCVCVASRRHRADATRIQVGTASSLNPVRTHVLHAPKRLHATKPLTYTRAPAPSPPHAHLKLRLKGKPQGLVESFLGVSARIRLGSMVKLPTPPQLVGSAPKTRLAAAGTERVSLSVGA